MREARWVERDVWTGSGQRGLGDVGGQGSGPKRPLLSAAMIVRDEQEHLAGCLASIRAVCDEIVVVDTGSVDATVEIARSFGAVVIEHAWAQDFSAARNVALQHTLGRWILSIDADERLRPLPPELVRSTLTLSTDVALRVRWRPFTGWTPQWMYRLWRADPRIRWTGVMHETVRDSILEVYGAERGTISESPLFIEHVGYDGDQTHKHRRNAPLLKTQLERVPDDTHNWVHLALVHEGLAEPERSDEALEQAVALARGRRVRSGGLAFYLLILRRLEQGAEVEALLAEGLTLYPDNFALAWTQVCAQIERDEYALALDALDRFSVDTEMPVEEDVAYPETLFGLLPEMARALCLFKLERYAEAAAAYASVEALDPDDQSHRLRRRLAEHRAAEQAAGPTGPAPASDTARACGAVGGAVGGAVDCAVGGTVGDAVGRWSARELTAGITIDIGGVAVGLSATDAARAHAIRGLLGRMPLTTATPQATLAFGSCRTHPPVREPDEAVGDLRLWHGSDGLDIEYGPSAGASTQGAVGRLGAQLVDLGRVFRTVAPFMLSDLLGSYGRYVIHAAAIQCHGQTILVFGDSGAGKSTLVLGAIQSGWGVLSDDLVLLQAGESGPLVSGIPKALAVPPDVLGGEAKSPGRLLRNDARRRRELRFEGWARGAHPVGGVVMVAHGDQPEAVLTPVSDELLISQLLQSMLSRQPGVLRAYMSTVLRLSALPTARLLHSSLADSRPERAAAALADYLAPDVTAVTSCSERSISRHSWTSSSGGSGSSYRL